MRERDRPLPLSAYTQLAALARRAKSPGPLTALTPVDMLATAQQEVVPMVWGARNRIGLAATNLGTVERAGVAGFLSFVTVYSLANLFGLGHPAEIDPFEGW